MLYNKVISVIIPAYNEENKIANVINSMPSFVDRIIVINDGSTDGTEKVVLEMMENEMINLSIPLNTIEYQNQQEFHERGFPSFSLATRNFISDRIILLQHHQNCGKGAGIKTGYNFSKKLGIDCVATMDGDGQMRADELINICLPIIQEGVDYVKGNRLSHNNSNTIIPINRLWGNRILSMLTKPASGYWEINDTQTGFTAISKNAIQKIKLSDIFTYYGYPNDILVKLNIANCVIKEVPVTPVYLPHHTSRMKMHLVIPKISWLIAKSFFIRIYIKYFQQRIHPIFIYYVICFSTLLCWIIADVLSNLSVFYHILFAFTCLCSGFMAITTEKRLNKPLFRN